MQITKDTVVQFHYRLTNEKGDLIESSEGNAPTAYLHGHRNVITGIEAAMEGKQAGETFSTTITPENAYGPHNPNAVHRVPVKHLSGAKRWRPGMIATVHTEQGQRKVRVVKVGKFMADVDTNHPLAGQTLTFDIEVVDVREATPEEVTHGHAHGVGGHHH